MNKIVINLADAVKAGVKCSLGVDADGNVTVTGQKTLTDSTSGETVDDGSPFAVILQSSDQANLSAAIQGILTPIVQAQLVPPASTVVATT